MNEQAEDKAVNEFERWVRESIEIDSAFANGQMDTWLKNKIARETAYLDKLTGQNNGNTNVPESGQ